MFDCILEHNFEIHTHKKEEEYSYERQIVLSMHNFSEKEQEFIIIFFFSFLSVSLFIKICLPSWDITALLFKTSIFSSFFSELVSPLVSFHQKHRVWIMHEAFPLKCLDCFGYFQKVD